MKEGLMKLELNNISVDCIIGERPNERVTPQQLRVDVSRELVETASETDELADTVDYAALTERIRATLRVAQCKMIERAARLAGEACLADERVRSAEVRVVKSGAIPHLESAAAVWKGER